MPLLSVRNRQVMIVIIVFMDRYKFEMIKIVITSSVCLKTALEKCGEVSFLNFSPRTPFAGTLNWAPLKIPRIVAELFNSFWRLTFPYSRDRPEITE